MTVTIERNAKFWDLPLSRVRNVIRAWRFGSSKSAADIAERRDVDLDLRVVMALLDEFRDRGLIGIEDLSATIGHEGLIDGLTERGYGLVAATAQGRISKEKARAIFADFLTVCTEINTRNSLPFAVSRIWLFGSLLEESKIVAGDIDFVVETEMLIADRDEADRQFEMLAEELGNVPFPEFRICGRGAAVIQRMLYGRTRHPRLKPNDLDTLIEKGFQCQLVFDRTRGGLISDEILPWHPQANGRANDMPNRKVLPDLSEGALPLRPLPVDLLDDPAGTIHCLRRQGNGLWPDGDNRYQGLWGYDHRTSMYQITKAHPFPDVLGLHNGDVLKKSVITDRLDFGECDGRTKFGLLFTENFGVDLKGRTLSKEDAWALRWGKTKNGYRPICGYIVERAITETADTVEYHIGISHGVRGSSYDYSCHTGTLHWLYLVATADILHIRMRDAEQQRARTLSVVVEENDPVGDLVPYALDLALQEFVQPRQAAAA